MIDRLKLLILVAFATITVVGCSNTRSRPMPLAPHGVALPAGVLPNTLFRGLYVGEVGSTGCCWLAPRAELALTKRRFARKLVLVIYLPAAGREGETAISSWLGRHPLDINVSINGGAPERACCFGPGLHGASFKLSDANAHVTGLIYVDVWTNGAFVPATIDANSRDVRRLGPLLVRVFWD